MFDALVFDLDGTLWNATEYSTLGWNNALQSLGIDREITIGELQKVMGKPGEECVRILLPAELERYPNLLEIIKHHEKIAIQTNGGKLYDSLETTIKSLSRKYNLFLVSNCGEWYLNEFFKFSGIKEFLRDYDCYGISKENKREMLTKLKQKHQFAKPAYIGDTESDQIAAGDAGYTFIFASYGFGVSPNPDLKINSLAELLDMG
ncbi:MAG: HAD family hydrolase [Firmicutes bacterium]|nr:HAD family hydrolase [Bacillota bacterium]